MKVVLGLGANLGERLATLRAAVDAIAALPAVTVLARSHVYETAPVGPPQPDYLNAAILVECTCDLEDLMTSLLAIEARLGRERRERWGPRTLDLDVLWAGATVLETPRLTVPHPRLTERAFALRPLLDVAPEATDPRSGARYSELAMKDADGVRLFAERL